MTLSKVNYIVSIHRLQKVFINGRICANDNRKEHMKIKYSVEY